MSTNIRLIELFAGIGAQAKALRNLGIEFEHHRVVEIDKYCIKSYNAIHDTNFKPCDITKLKGSELSISDTDKYTYLMTYSFPCQDLSLAGRHKGMAKGSGTRSGLLWEVERLLNEVDELPQILLMENVTQVHNKRNIDDFNKWISFLESKGYKNYWQDLNAKDYGIPQNRNRCFMISTIYDIDIKFPKPFELKLKLKDLLENEVDEKYYLSDEQVERIKISQCEIQEPKCVRVGGIYDKENKINQAGGIYDKNGISPTLTTMTTGGGQQPFIMIKNCTKQGYLEANDGDGCYISNIDKKRGTVQKNMIPTIKTSLDIGVVDKRLRIRKLTPKECWRLMGFSDEDFEKCKELSNSQLYKQAGNSIVVNVLEEIIRGIYDKL